MICVIRFPVYTVLGRGLRSSIGLLILQVSKRASSLLFELLHRGAFSLSSSYVVAVFQCVVTDYYVAAK